MSNYMAITFSVLFDPLTPTLSPKGERESRQ